MRPQTILSRSFAGLAVRNGPFVTRLLELWRTVTGVPHIDMEQLRRPMLQRLFLCWQLPDLTQHNLPIDTVLREFFLAETL